MLFRSLFQQFYNLADTIIVGRFVGVEALAAVGSVGGLNYLVLGFVNGIACGFSIPISWTFGAKDYVEMRRYTANAVWLSVTQIGLSFLHSQCQLALENEMLRKYTILVMLYKFERELIYQLTTKDIPELKRAAESKPCEDEEHEIR